MSVTMGSIRIGVDGIAPLARIAHADRKAREPFDRLADVLAAHGRGDDVLDFGDVETEARRRHPVDGHVDVASAFEPLGQRRGDAGDALRRALDRLRHAVDDGKIRDRRP